ncbi:hypothetical protein CDD83_7226 [Cordyceps sp. RAO-2017]|nr:hypothetical protein CDD83_7226 [Cordyceps sp. RAO-2017]
MRFPARRASAGYDAHLGPRTFGVTIARRDLSDKNIAFIVIVVVLFLLTITAFVLINFAKRRRRRQRQRQKPGNRNGTLDNTLDVWHSDHGSREGQDTTDRQRSPRPNRLMPLSNRERGRTSRGAHASRTAVSGSTGDNGDGGGDRNSTANDAAADTAVDRSASVRSIMTLPPYRLNASNNEQVIGREGDRDGIDVIIDMNTAEADEALREEEMQALYQVRLAGQRRVAQMEDIRRQRHEARRQNDTEALAELGARSRAASDAGELDDLRREVTRIQETRQRSVSRVSYAELGVARHDGTRIRANSNESERMGLLSDAASIAISSQSRLPSPELHRRQRSTSSLVSVDSDILPGPTARPRGPSGTETGRPLSGATWARSSLELEETDLGDEDMPPPDYRNVSLDGSGERTPLYEPPPDYPGPHRPPLRRMERSSSSEDVATERSRTSRDGRGVGGVPQLPSLRIPNLPAIVIEPSSSHPGHT